MKQDNSTYYVTIGGSCDYNHKDRFGAAAVFVEYAGNVVSSDVVADVHTTEFRMMLSLMLKVMRELPAGSRVLFFSNAAYIQNFDRTPTTKSANSDLILQCIEAKKLHASVAVKVVPYHKSPLLQQTHVVATDAMMSLRRERGRSV